MLVAVVSGKGSPGVSVSALAWALEWPGPCLLAECDPRGGEYVVGYAHEQAGSGRDLLSVHVGSRRGVSMDQVIRDNVLQLADGRWMLPGVPEPHQAAGIDWARLARALSQMPGVDVIADCGAVTALGAPNQVWAAADLVLLVLRATAPSVRAAQRAVPRLRADLRELGLGPDRLAAVIIGAGQPYSQREVAEALQPKGDQRVPIAADLPLDERVATFLSSGVTTPRSKAFARSKFANDARTTARQIAELAQELRHRAAELDRYSKSLARTNGGVRS